MVQIVLKPLDDGQKDVEIPLGKTTIGRGPLLGCNDKKVSRNHAVLEVTQDGEVFLTPTHVNPCFFQPTGDSPGTILRKDVAHKLQDGDAFSLLPRAYRYQLCISSTVLCDSTTNTNCERQQCDSTKNREEPVTSNEDEGNVHDTGQQEASEENGEAEPVEEQPAVATEVEEEKPEPCDSDKVNDKKFEAVPVQKPEKASKKERINSTKKRKEPKLKEEPKQRKRRAKAEPVERPPERTSARTNRQTRQGLSLEDFVVSDDDEWESEGRKRRRRRKRRTDSSGDAVHHDSGGSDSSSPKKKGARGRRKKTEVEPEAGASSRKKIPCSYGKKCYRKSDSHLSEFSHPAADAPSDSEEEEASPKKECPYGENCFRKNPQHKKDFRHTKRTRPQREAARQAADKKAKRSSEDSFELNEDDDSLDEFKPYEYRKDSGSEYEERAAAPPKVAAKRGRKPRRL